MGGGASKGPQVHLAHDRKWDDVVAPVGPGTMKVVHFDHFRKLKSIPSLKNAEPIDLSLIERDKSLIVFVSHQFRCEARQASRRPVSEDSPRLATYLKGAMTFRKPDTIDNDKFNLIVTGIEHLVLNHIPAGVKVFLWIDYCCIDFDNPSEVAASKKRLDHYIRMSDCLFTPVVDPEWSTWVRPKVLNHFFEDYRATMWKSYLERGWCRMEAFLGAYISCVDSDKFESYTGAFKHFGTVLKLRPHLLYGTREMMLRDSPVFLPPLRSEFFTQYHPSAGRFHLEADRSHIAGHVKNYQLHVARLDHDHLRRYTGSRKKGQRDGHGSFTFREGHCYEGMWSADNRHGQGRLVYACGDVYSGEWVQNLRSGTGTHWYCNGDRYDGTFYYGEKSGKGTLMVLHTGMELKRIRVDPRTQGSTGWTKEMEKENSRLQMVMCIKESGAMAECMALVYISIRNRKGDTRVVGAMT
ncbi:hypothetical protein CYMTET_24128 [Cymbomonas tetramitiformis]|uniref:Heterokaryon incompatibility domain-containing protein n=1 Tax=Cymbomonas tetramitiformis TaxID=36881 RepID=A0AAE0L0J0_9CHLO|nr:hypothetical protein CYMTET_24128 [Cymbomonas tetramitiformis]